MKVLIFFLFTFLIVGCQSNYEKGVEALQRHNPQAAKEYFNRVSITNDYYDSAITKIKEIENNEMDKMLSNAISLFNRKYYKEARELLVKINANYDSYVEAAHYIHLIDSLEPIHKKNLIRLGEEKGLRMEQQRISREKGKKVEEEKERQEMIEMEQRLKAMEKELIAEAWQNSGPTILKIKSNARALYNELMSFKNSSSFHVAGFEIGGPYNSWLVRVKNLRKLENTIGTDFVTYTGFTIGELELLGHEYYSTDGRENEYTRYARSLIIQGLK